ncbi:MAG: LytTR family DNA-binding domain-containing protein [Candidatus Cloacimonetes bacterium]|nr:LytTR family DNA-binding domain-containing protein [Candidatus Cloacimonadota bacterium]
MKYRTILIEDEQVAMQNLERLLREHTDKLEIIGKAVNGIEALELINSQKPDLIFLDIQMPGMNGFEVLANLEHLPLVIFTTAYIEYALKAFETHAVDYILKPLSQQKIQNALAKLEHFSQNPDWQAILQNLVNDLGKTTRLAIPFNNRIIFVDYKDIYYLKADNKYTEVHLFEKSYLINQTLTELESKLGGDFVRLHRSNIVNRNYISEIIKLFTRKWVARLTDKANTELPISRESREKLF